MRFGKLAILIPVLAAAADANPRPAANEAFDRYVALTEARINTEEASGLFLSIERLPESEHAELQRRLARGEVVIQKLKTEDHGREIAAPGGLIHHWVATAFIPGTTLQQVLALVQDYDHQQEFYSPDVQQSRLISHNGDDFHIFLRFRRAKVLTVVLDTEHDVHYNRIDSYRASSRSISTRIAEVVGAGHAGEHELPAGKDHGFLWRLNSYWRFYQVDGGVYVECEAISLTRDIPAGLGWLIGPFVESVPRESLLFTMTATRKALENHGKELVGRWGGNSELTTSSQHRELF